MTDVRIAERVSDLPVNAWEALATSPYVSPAWYRACEKTWPDLRFRYIAAFDGGRLTAVLPIHDRAGRYGMHPIRLYEARLSKWARLFLRCASTGSPLSLIGQAAGDASLQPLLLEAAAGAARALGCDTLVVPCLLQPDAPSAMDVRPSMPEFHLDVPGRGFDDYLAARDKKRRWNIRKELRLVSHLQFDVRPLADCVEDVARLHAMNRRRYRTQDAAEARFYPALAAEFGDAARAVLAREGGRVVGMSLFLAHRDTLYVMHTGSEQRDLSYFSLCFYEPLRYAYAHGARHIHMRRAAGHGKRLRGALDRPAWAALQPLTWRGRLVARLGT